MPWVRFTDNMDWSPVTQQIFAYKAGQEYLVTTPCAKQAVDLGVAVRIKSTAKKKQSEEIDLNGDEQ